MSVREVFDRSASGYDRTRRILVPCFDDFYGSALAALPFEPSREIEVLDLGAGTASSRSSWPSASGRRAAALVRAARRRGLSRRTPVC